MPTSRDVLDRIAALAPDPRSLVDAEWPADDRRWLLADITGRELPGDRSASVDGRTLQLPLIPYAPTPAKHRWALPVAAAIATVTATAGIVLGVRGTDHSSDAGGPGATSGASASALSRPFNPPSGLSTKVPAGRYYYHVDRSTDLDAMGKEKPGTAELNRSWIDGNGNTVSVRTGPQYGCVRFPRSASDPTRAFFAAIPTDVTELKAYLRSHAEGSSSRDEAVFVEVGDSLSMYGGLASPRLRAAMLAVLSRTPGVRVFLGQKDYLRRPAIRADFVNQLIRPGEIQSYYFDPTNFRFLQASRSHNSQPAPYHGPSRAPTSADDPKQLRGSHNSQPSTYNGPSPAYTAAAPSTADDPEQLRTDSVDVVIEERMVQTLPAEAASCHGSLVDRRVPIPAPQS